MCGYEGDVVSSIRPFDAQWVVYRQTPYSVDLDLNVQCHPSSLCSNPYGNLDKETPDPPEQDDDADDHSGQFEDGDLVPGASHACDSPCTALERGRQAREDFILESGREESIVSACTVFPSRGFFLGKASYRIKRN